MLTDYNVSHKLSLNLVENEYARDMYENMYRALCETILMNHRELVEKHLGETLELLHIFKPLTLNSFWNF